MPRASGLAARIRTERGIESVLVPGSGGEFEVTVDGRLAFSKRAEGRFPDHEEILALLPSA